MAARDDANNVQTAIRIPGGWVPRLQEVAGRLSRPGIPLTQADAMRAALATGLDALEAELGITRTPVTAATRETVEHGIRDDAPAKRPGKGKAKR